MADAAAEKLVVMVTHGPDEPERATIPFAMAGAAVASDVDVVIGFQDDGCMLMRKGVAETVSAPNFAPLGELLPVLQELGAKLLVCGPSATTRGLTEDDLVEGAELVAAARFVAEVTSATQTLIY